MTTTTPLDAALAHARDAVDAALDALNTIGCPDGDGVLALIRAQAELETAARRLALRA